MKLVFDSSIHLGQFCISDEAVRIASKNSQIMISDKPTGDVIGVESFNEVAYADDIIWGIDPARQEGFYKFMDTFHSEKNINRIPPQVVDIHLMIEIMELYPVHPSNALTCAVAIKQKADVLHSFYSDFQRPDIVEYLGSHGIVLNEWVIDAEKTFSNNVLESYYQNTLNEFKTHAINLTDFLHQ